ncbi:hypothetical protein DFH94DRAFT_684607 [Russula ochroleuca]|uniref:Uncharacterized protein n=1 Tax=Russula ochroleuca TaxID=152965 RepID=A0A9P5JZM5_9AGAM|nr:hypothetical protein DFH94DRAFT_684607 [Russula ochroleuca]
MSSPRSSSPHCTENGENQSMSPVSQSNQSSPAPSDATDYPISNSSGSDGYRSRAPTPQCLPSDDQIPELDVASQDAIYHCMDIARCLVVDAQSRAATPCPSPNVSPHEDPEMEMLTDSVQAAPKALEWPPAPFTLASALTLDELPDSDLWYRPEYQLTQEWLEQTIKYLKDIDEEKRVTTEREVDTSEIVRFVEGDPEDLLLVYGLPDEDAEPINSKESFGQGRLWDVRGKCGATSQLWDGNDPFPHPLDAAAALTVSWSFKFQRDRRKTTTWSRSRFTNSVPPLDIDLTLIPYAEDICSTEIQDVSSGGVACSAKSGLTSVCLTWLDVNGTTGTFGMTAYTNRHVFYEILTAATRIPSCIMAAYKPSVQDSWHEDRGGLGQFIEASWTPIRQPGRAQARSTGMCFSRTPEEVFNAALVEYVKQTGNDLSKHPLSTKLENCKLPSDVLDVIGELAKTFHPKEGNKSLVKALEPTVNVVCSLSGAFGNSIGIPTSISNLWQRWSPLYGLYLPSPR